LRLTRAQNYTGAFFHWGGVYAFNPGGGNAIYNPVTAGLVGWPSNWSGDPSHTNANLRQGKGDPCRLVGYTAQFIRSEVAAGRTPDNGLYRITGSSDWQQGARSGWNVANGFNGLYFPQGTGSAWMPAGGMLSNSITGALNYQGTEGRYWTDESAGGFPGNAAYIYFTSSTVTVGYVSGSSTYGMMVRCVRR